MPGTSSAKLLVSAPTESWLKIIANPTFSGFDRIITKARPGDQFVSIDGKRTYFDIGPSRAPAATRGRPRVTGQVALSSQPRAHCPMTVGRIYLHSRSDCLCLTFWSHWLYPIYLHSRSDCLFLPPGDWSNPSTGRPECPLSKPDENPTNGDTSTTDKSFKDKLRSSNPDQEELRPRGWIRLAC